MDLVLNQPTFLICQSVTFDLRSTYQYSKSSKDFILWIERTFIPFLSSFKEIVTPVIKVFQKYRSHEGSALVNALQNSEYLDELISKSDKISEQANLLQLDFDTLDSSISKVKQRISRLHSLRLALQAKGNLKNNQKSIDANEELLTAELDDFTKKRKILLKRRELMVKENESLRVESSIMDRKVSSNRKIVDEFFEKYEKAEKELRERCFMTELFEQFSTTLLERLNKVYFNVIELLSEDEIMKQIDVYIEEEEKDLKKKYDDKIQHRSVQSSKASSSNSSFEKPVKHEFVPDISRLLKKAYVRDESKEIVEIEKELERLDQQLKSLKKRTDELQREFVNDAMRRMRSDLEETRNLGALHYNMYQKIMTSFQSESIVIQMAKEDLQLKLGTSLLDR